MALTRDAIFWDGFSRHAQCSVQAAALVEKMLNTTPPAEIEALQKEVAILEQTGDTITHNVLSALHQTWITPLDREEIHSLIKTLDDILDMIEEAGELVLLYRAQPVRPEAHQLAEQLRKAVDQVAELMVALQDLKNLERLQSLCKSINEIENDGDRTLRRAIARLFQEEKNAVEVIKWRDIFGALESAIDSAEDLAHIVEGILLEHA